MGMMTSQYRKVAPARIEQREAVRYPVLLQRVTAHRKSKMPHEAHLVDISAYGCRLFTNTEFQIGEQLSLRFADNHPVNATVVWTEGNRLGCKFDEILERELFRKLTLRSS